MPCFSVYIYIYMMTVWYSGFLPHHWCCRLVGVEDNLRQEQEVLHATISQKQKVIEVQERRIQSLDAANSRLLLALAQVKDRCQLAPSQNGVTTASSPCAGKTKLMLSNENGQLKSSSCWYRLQPCTVGPLYLVPTSIICLLGLE